MSPTIAVPTILQDPGFLFWAPLATAEPTNTVAASAFSDLWSASWIMLGATEEGSAFSTQTTFEKTYVAEFLTAIRSGATERETSLSFALADWTLANFKKVNNGGAATVVSGTGATALNKYEEPDLGDEVRCMLGWESLDGTVRLIARQCINTGAIESANRKAPDKALLAAQFDFEQPVGAKPYTFYTAGTARA